MIYLQCPSCKHDLEVADYLAGLPIVCKFCCVSVPVPAKTGSAVSESSSSKLAQRLSFIQKAPSQPPPPSVVPENFAKGPLISPGGKGLIAGLAVLLGAGIVALFALNLPGNGKKPAKEIAQSTPDDPKPGPGEISDDPPPGKQPPEKKLPDDPPKEELKEVKHAAPLSPDEIYHRVVKSTAWVFDRQDIANSEWVGQEERPGFGNLKIVFASSSIVLLLPAKGKAIGTWTKRGNEVTLRFMNGGVVYSGTIDGRTIKGSAEDGQQKWAWSTSRGGKGIGSGVLVDKKHRLLLTNVHVVGDSPGVTVYFPEYDKDELIARRDHYHPKAGIAGKVVLRNEKTDLALVELEELPEGLEAVPLAEKSARPAQPVLSVGNPGVSGALWNSARGQVRQVFPYKWKITDELTGKVNHFDSWILETDSSINPGDSGGPLVDGQCRLIGIAHAVHITTKNLSVFIDVRECRTILESYYQHLEGRIPNDQ